MARYYIEEDPENPGHMTKKLICGSFLDASPIGTVHAYAGSSVPAGWLACNGQAVSRSEYQFLFNIIGTTYGSGDGSTTFNVPDYRECALVGIGTNNTDTIATDDVYTLGEFKDDQFQEHVHNAGHDTNSASYSHVRYDASVPKGYDFSQMIIKNPTTGRHGDVTRGKRKGVNYIIKAKLEANAGDIGLKTGIPVPDWANAIAISAAQITAGYTAPSAGVVVGWIEPVVGRTFDIQINNIVISTGYYASSRTILNSPIGKSDIVKATAAPGSCVINFVPYKLQFE